MLLVVCCFVGILVVSCVFPGPTTNIKIFERRTLVKFIPNILPLFSLLSLVTFNIVIRNLRSGRNISDVK